MRRVVPAIAFALACLLAGGTFGHEKKCEEFGTYAEAVKHCKAGPPHEWPRKCGSHDRDKDQMPCECLPGGPEVNSNACKAKARKKR